MKKIFLFLGLGLCSSWTSAWCGGGLACEVQAPIALLVDAETGAVLFSKKAEEECYPASVTKMATALYVFYKAQDRLHYKAKASLDALMVVSPAVRRSSGKHPSYRLEVGGTSIGLKLEEEVDLRSLLYGLLLASGNDAANVLAEAVSGSVEQFMIELNQFLESIGCTHTHFQNPHGMPDVGHITTATDLALIARKALEYPEFCEMVASVAYEKPETNKQAECVFRQHNHLLREGKYYYPYATGIKTGWTVKSGYTLVASAEKEDRKLIAVVARCEELAHRYRSAMDLFEAAFTEEKQSRTLLCQGADRFHTQVDGGKEEIEAALSEDLIATYYPSENPTFSYRTTWRPCALPIHVGDEVGIVTLMDNWGRARKMVPLLSVKEVEPTWGHRLSLLWMELGLVVKKHKMYGGYFLATLLLTGAYLWRHRAHRNIQKKKRK